MPDRNIKCNPLKSGAPVERVSPRLTILRYPFLPPPSPLPALFPTLFYPTPARERPRSLHPRRDHAIHPRTSKLTSNPSPRTPFPLASSRPYPEALLLRRLKLPVGPWALRQVAVPRPSGRRPLPDIPFTRFLFFFHAMLPIYIYFTPRSIHTSIQFLPRNFIVG